MNTLATLSAYEGEIWFAELSDEGRRSVRELGAAIDRIEKAPRCKRCAAQAREAAMLGMGESTLRSWIAKFKKHGPRGLVDHRKEPHQEAKLPPAFLEFWKSLCEENQRADRPAWRKLRELYRSHATEYQWQETSDVVQLWPGYDERPEPSPSSNDGLPRGWSYSNLTRVGNGLTKVEELAARLGPIAASELLDQVFTTRVGLKPGQCYVFDDRWLDVKATMPPSVARKPVRSVELSCGDIASAKTVAWGLLPMIDDDAGRQQRLKDTDMRMLLVRVLCGIGFHKDGVTLYVEHGTAAISGELELYLCVASGGTVENGEIVKPGAIRVKRSGIKGGKRYAGGYLSIGKGNFRFKASRESNHNLMHNELADLPGQVGKNSRLETVEDDHGRDAEACFLLNAAAELDPEIAVAIQTGYLPFKKLWQKNADAIKRIDDYIDHRLQGWADCGYLTSEFRLDYGAPWQPMTNLLRYEDGQRMAIQAFIDSADWSTRTRQLSRGEAWKKGERDLVTLPAHCVPEILGARMAVPKAVGDDGCFTFTKAGEDDLIYRAVVRTPQGYDTTLTAGVTYRTWINPYDTSVLFVSNYAGGFLGTCELKERLDRHDTDAFKREATESAIVQAEVLGKFNARAVKRHRADTRKRQMNTGLVEQAATTLAAIEDYEAPDFGSMTK